MIDTVQPTKKISIYFFITHLSNNISLKNFLYSSTATYLLIVIQKWVTESEMGVYLSPYQKKKCFVFFVFCCLWVLFSCFFVFLFFIKYTR